MSDLDIIIPVRNEAKSIYSLVKRIKQTLSPTRIEYNLLFIDDHSSDKTVEVLKVLKKVYPIKIYIKQGTPGKSYSILEGVGYSKANLLLMIDGDGQYPPEAIPQMLNLIKTHGLVIASRKNYQDSALRGLFSQVFSFIFGTLLHGFRHDVQSGLKLFRREIALQIAADEVTPWTLDLTLLNTARELGFSIGEVEITFAKREFGKSKVNLLETSWEIGTSALWLKFNKKRIFFIRPEKAMIGAGIIHNRKRLITHTTLPLSQMAFKTFLNWQKALVLLILEVVFFGILLYPLATVITLVALLSLIYFIDVIFNLTVVLKSLHFPPEISIRPEALERISEKSLPVYSILCPLYKEANVLEDFLASIEKLDWPKKKLDVLLLLEESDRETIAQAASLNLPQYVRTIIVPDSELKTKPKACNFGLSHAKGEYLVIYDAEDRPDPLQLKKAYLAFQEVDKNTICLQAKLNYFNPNQNLLTRFFTAEYSLWFDVILTGFQSINTTIPLGGTSNHFKTNSLLKLRGWDPFNVTEDCDLGVRLFKAGYKTAIIDSTTLEEANSNTKNWLRQRSRWIKGYMQTYLVHMRNPDEFVKNHGIHALIFQLIIGARISFMLINPFLWLMTLSYFALYSLVGPTIESFYPSLVFYMAAFSLVFGNFTYIYNYMIGCAKTGHYSLIKYVYLIPIYWLLTSIAATIAFYQLLVKPHYWEKTNHGLNINKKDEIEIPRISIKPAIN